MTELRRLILGALALAATALPVQAAPERYELDPEHTTVAFLIAHVGYAATLGRFTEVEGGFTYDRETQELTDLTVTVNTDSLDTDNDARDGHVKSGDFLDTGAHPTMTFTAEGGTPASADKGTVEGTLTLLGQARPLVLDVTLNKAGAYPFGHKRFVLGISGRGSVKRSDYGMTYGVANGLVGDTVSLIIETEGMRME